MSSPTASLPILLRTAHSVHAWPCCGRSAFSVPASASWHGVPSCGQLSLSVRGGQVEHEHGGDVGGLGQDAGCVMTLVRSSLGPEWRAARGPGSPPFFTHRLQASAMHRAICERYAALFRNRAAPEPMCSVTAGLQGWRIENRLRQNVRDARASDLSEAVTRTKPGLANASLPGQHYAWRLGLRTDRAEPLASLQRDRTPPVHLQLRSIV